MRYKEPNNGEIVIPTEQLASHASNDMLILTAILGVIIGLIFIVGGRLAKQMWIWVWGIGLVVVSAYLGYSIKYGVRLFEYF